MSDISATSINNRLSVDPTNFYLMCMTSLGQSLLYYFESAVFVLFEHIRKRSFDVDALSIHKSIAHIISYTNVENYWKQR